MTVLIWKTDHRMPVSIWKMTVTIWKMTVSMWKMTVSIWKMTVSTWKMTVSIWKMTVTIWDILSLCLRGGSDRAPGRGVQEHAVWHVWHQRQGIAAQVEFESKI